VLLAAVISAALAVAFAVREAGEEERRSTMGYEAMPEPGPYEVAEESPEWLDASRSRPVKVHIYAPAVSLKGPLPALLISHGLGETRDSYGYLARYWASHGYVVVAMNHEGSDLSALRRLQGGETALAQLDHFSLRFGDLSFVIDRMLAADQESALLRGRVDADRIGIAGHSMGGDTAFQAVGMTINLPNGGGKKTFREPRVKAALQMGPHVGSAADPPDAPKNTSTKRAITIEAYDQIREPAMVMWGTRDREFDEPLRSNPDARRVIYQRLPAEHKYMVDIVNAEHHAFSETPPWYPGGPRDPRHHGWIQQVTLAFFDAHVRGDAAALSWLESDAVVDLAGGEIIYDWGRRAAARPPVGSAYKAERGPLPVASLAKLPLADPSRGRDVPVRVTYPTAPGRYPIVVFSHASAGTKDQYAPLMEFWASHGYVCVQPDHTDSPNLSGSRNDFTNRWDRVKDVELILNSISRIEEAIAVPGFSLFGDRAAVGGHFYGADTAELAAGMKVFGPEASMSVERDPRIKAVLAIAGQGLGQGLTEQSWAGLRLPLLVLTGSLTPSPRTGNDARWRVDPYTYSPPGDKYLVYVEGLGAWLAGLGHGSREADEDLAAVVRSATVAFLDTYVRGDGGALDPLNSGSFGQAPFEFSRK
jgi:predicted dienelactone hydrolase